MPAGHCCFDPHQMQGELDCTPRPDAKSTVSGSICKNERLGVGWGSCPKVACGNFNGIDAGICHLGHAPPFIDRSDLSRYPWPKRVHRIIPICRASKQSTNANARDEFERRYATRQDAWQRP
jgi:hypothetical protein